MATTRRQFRRDILRSLGDLRVLTATAPSTSNVTFTDALNLVGEVGIYTGREVLFTGGTAANIGQQRYITGSSSNSRSIGFGDALPAIPALGDECEMVNTRGIGFRFQDVHEAINQSIRVVSRDAYLEPTTIDETTYTYGTPIVLPPEFVTVEDVQWQDLTDTARLHSIPKANRPNGKGWWIDRATRTLNITGPLIPFSFNYFDGVFSPPYTIRIWGLVEPAQLFDDLDETSINQGWLTSSSIALLLKGRYYRMPTPETERLMYDALQESRSLSARATTRRSPFSEML